MNKKYNTEISLSQIKEISNNLHPNRKINGIGRDNTGEYIDFKSMSNRDEVGDKVSALLTMVKVKI